MASLPTVTVHVESVIHKALSDVVQAIWREHGIRVDSIEAHWTELQHIDEPMPRCILRSIDINSRSYSDVSRGAESQL